MNRVGEKVLKQVCKTGVNKVVVGCDEGDNDEEEQSIAGKSCQVLPSGGKSRNRVCPKILCYNRSALGIALQAVIQ